MINEIEARKYINQIVKYGISKAIAKEIVELAYEICKGHEVEVYIHYAVTLKYNINVNVGIENQIKQKLHSKIY